MMLFHCHFSSFIGVGNVCLGLPFVYIGVDSDNCHAC